MKFCSQRAERKKFRRHMQQRWPLKAAVNGMGVELVKVVNGMGNW